MPHFFLVSGFSNGMSRPAALRRIALPVIGTALAGLGSAYDLSKRLH